MSSYMPRADGMYEKTKRKNRRLAVGAITALFAAVYATSIFADHAVGEANTEAALTDRGYTNIEQTSVDYRILGGDLALAGCGITDVARHSFTATSPKGKPGVMLEACIGPFNLGDPAITLRQAAKK